MAPEAIMAQDKSTDALVRAPTPPPHSTPMFSSTHSQQSFALQVTQGASQGVSEAFTQTCC